MAWFFTASPVQARQTVSEFLLTAFEDRNLSQYDAQISFLRPSNYRFPVVDEVEVRMGNDELTYEDLQYALRLKPGNPWKIRRNNAFFNATKKEIDLRKKLEYKENLQRRYEVVLDYFQQKNTAALIEERLSIASKQTSIMEENFESELFDAEDYAESKINQVEDIEDLDEVLVKLNETKVEIQLILEHRPPDWEMFNLITISSIEKVVNEIVNATFDDAELELIAQQIEVARQEVRVEKADFDIGYIQLEYFPFRDIDDSEYGVSVGLTLPLFRDNKPQIAERKLDEIELKNEFTLEQYQDSVNKIKSYEHLKNLIAHHQLIVDKTEELNLDAMSQNLANSEDYNPIIILELEESILQLEEVLLKSKYRVLTQFIDFLFTFDALIQKPLTNYISEDLDLIE
ncbi:MAG: hypothetical protein FH748_03980 [Balneolaceae bacterium]|nr:hypothetical protein [Balneolaceae bacterium]